MKKMLVLMLFISLQSQAQFYLKPHIGPMTLPQNNDPICTIPTYSGNFNTTGLMAGDTSYDFTLFSVSGDTLSLSSELANGLPILLVNSSYTCPVYRNKVNMINQVANTYNGQIKVFVVYTVEAHPTDVSPYFGYINVTNANQSQGILYAQPTTYQERKNIVNDMLQAMTINVPVFLDNPCNEWWSTYGPAPNNAYLIDTDGTVFAKHPWFDKNPIDYILCDIDSLLYSTPCNPTSGSGNFIVNQLDTLVTGAAGNILYGFSDLINPTNSPINVMAVKIQKNYPANWQTVFCADVCYTPAEDTIYFSLPANDTMHFSIDFITDAVPDSGNIRIGFRNMNNSSNGQVIRVFANTTAPNQVSAFKKADFNFSPNPSSGKVVLQDYQGEMIEVITTLGKKVGQLSLDSSKEVLLDFSELQKGLYFIGSRKIGYQKLIIN